MHASSKNPHPAKLKTRVAFVAVLLSQESTCRTVASFSDDGYLWKKGGRSWT